jgi:hypothetical protein
MKRKIGVPGGSRTPDRRIRNPMLYPAELRAHTGLFKITSTQAQVAGHILLFNPAHAGLLWHVISVNAA